MEANTPSKMKTAFDSTEFSFLLKLFKMYEMRNDKGKLICALSVSNILENRKDTRQEYSMPNCGTCNIIRSLRVTYPFDSNFVHCYGGSVQSYLLFLRDIYTYLFAENDAQGKIQFSFAPIVDWGDKKYGTIDGFTKRDFADIEIDLLLYAHQKGFLIDTSLVPKREFMPCMVVAKDSEVFDAFGNVYPCYEFTYTPAYNEDNTKLVIY